SQKSSFLVPLPVWMGVSFIPSYSRTPGTTLFFRMLSPSGSLPGLSQIRCTAGLSVNLRTLLPYLFMRRLLGTKGLHPGLSRPSYTCVCASRRQSNAQEYQQDSKQV